MLKHGHKEFRFEILEYCPVEELLKREQFYFDELKPEYNILKIAGSTLGYRHREASKILIGLASKTRVVSEVTRELRSKSLLGQKLSKQHLENMSLNNILKQSICLTNIGTGKTMEFPSMTAAGKYLGTSRTQVRNYLIKSTPWMVI